MAVDRNLARMYTAFLLFAITKGQPKFACETQLLWRRTLNVSINYVANVLRLTYSVNCPCRSTCSKFGIATGMSHCGDLKHIAMESVYGMTKWSNSWFLNYASLVLQMEAFKRKQTTSSSQNVSLKYFCNIISNNTKLCTESVTTNRYLFPYLCLTYPPHLKEFPSFFHHQLLPCALLPCLVASFRSMCSVIE
jgi:hypothetical protein